MSSEIEQWKKKLEKNCVQEENQYVATNEKEQKKYPNNLLLGDTNFISFWPRLLSVATIIFFQVYSFKLKYFQHFARGTTNSSVT